MFEFRKGKTVVYEADGETSCMVEMDEEPPHSLNSEAVEAGLQAALMFGSNPVNEIHVMRKIVIDGSNTSGFQRTCVIALSGSLNVGGREIPIQHVGLEEDAARKTAEQGMVVHYRIDRLGIPLIEVATAPSIHSPEEAQRVAEAIGNILKATGRVKRGIGTIRQDLNVSIADGAMTEIKGVQQLDIISKVVEYEAERQLKLLEIRDELKKRGLKEQDLQQNFVYVTEVFRNTSSKVVKDALARGGVVLALKLPGFSGFLGRELQPNVRLGTEMAYRAMLHGGVGGIFHTDELPKYGITNEEVEELRRMLSAEPVDAVVIVADSYENAADGLKAVLDRAREVLKGVPEETRIAKLDGTTHYMRPRPGAARMYPETDVPPVQVTGELLSGLKAALPPMPEVLVKQIMESYGLNSKLAEQLVNSDYLPIFRVIAEKTKIPTTFVATTLTEVFKNLEREGVQVENLTEHQLLGVFQLVDEGKTAKESVPDIVTWLAGKPEATPIQAAEALGLKMLSEDEVNRVIERRVKENVQLIREKREEAFGKLMNIVMGELRGKADAKIVASLLKMKIKEASNI